MSEDWYARYRRRVERRLLIEVYARSFEANNFAVFAQISRRRAVKILVRAREFATPVRPDPILKA